MGAIAGHGSHHDAQKSTITGTSALLQLGGIEIDRAPLKKLRVAAATLGSICRSIRRDGIDAIAARANDSPFIGHGTSSGKNSLA